MTPARPAAAAPSPRGPRRRGAFAPASRGFTLIEVLLVTVLLATLAAVTVPSLLRVFDEYSLSTSGEAVRGALSRARISAAREGVTYEFRTEPGGPRWVVVPGEREPAPQGTDAAAAAVPVFTGTLADGVRFPRAAGSSQLAGGRLDAAYFAGLPDASGLAQVNWSPPVLFLPDGTAAEAARVAVADDQGRAVVTTVRRLTGAAETGPITAAEGLR